MLWMGGGILSLSLCIFIFFKTNSITYTYNFCQRSLKPRLKPVFMYTKTIWIHVGMYRILNEYYVGPKKGVKCGYLKFLMYNFLFSWISFCINLLKKVHIFLFVLCLKTNAVDSPLFLCGSGSNSRFFVKQLLIY